MRKPKSDSEQNEALGSQVRLDGAGEDPAIKALQEMPANTNLENLDIALALQEIIRGQKLQGEMLARLRAKMDRMDKAAEKWEADRQRFINEINVQADKLRMSESKQEELMAKEGGKMTKLIEEARAAATSDRLRMEAFWANEPKETVVSPGEFKVINTGQAQEAKLLPEVLIIKHKSWVFPPGAPVEVPKSVADQLRSRRMVQAEGKEREAVLQQRLEASKLEAAQSRIDRKYKSPTERLQAG